MRLARKGAEKHPKPVGSSTFSPLGPANRRETVLEMGGRIVLDGANHTGAVAQGFNLEPR